MREVIKRNAFCHCEDVRSRERAKSLEAIMSRGRVSARVTAAQSAAVSQRMLDPPHAPSFLIEHEIVDHAADGQLGILFNGIVLQVLVAAIAIEKESPLGIPLA